MIQIQPLSNKEIQTEQLQKFSGYNLFSTVEFCNLWQCLGGKPVFWTAIENNKIIGVLPTVEFGMNKFKRLQSMPDGCYSNLLCDDDSLKDEIKKLIFDKILSAGYLKIYIYDYSNTYLLIEGFDKIKCNTALVEISENWMPPDKKLISEINKAKRENVNIQKFAYEKHFDKFIDLMKEAENRHDQKPKYPDEFFKELAIMSENNNSVQWLVVEYENELAASHINFIVNNTLLSWQIYFDKGFSFLKPNQLLLFQVAIDAAKTGIKILNLGSSPEEADSLKSYKEKWGGENYEYFCYVKKNWLGKLL